MVFLVYASLTLKIEYILSVSKKSNLLKKKPVKDRKHLPVYSFCNFKNMLRTFLGFRVGKLRTTEGLALQCCYKKNVYNKTEYCHKKLVEFGKENLGVFSRGTFLCYSVLSTYCVIIIEDYC